MFEDDRGRLLQIGEWLDAIEQGLVGVNETADEVLWYRLAMVEKSRARLTASYVAAHPEMAALPLPTLDAVLGERHPPVSEARTLAERTVEIFRALLNDLPPPPTPARAFQPSPDTRFDAVVDTLREWRLAFEPRAWPSSTSSDPSPGGRTMPIPTWISPLSKSMRPRLGSAC